jgi:hypothetical protein
VTQQNAALVEEMAAAASSLKSQADDLVETVSVFKLRGQEGHSVQRQRTPVNYNPAPLARPASAKLRAPAPRRAPIAAPKLSQTTASPKTPAQDDNADWETF